MPSCKPVGMEAHFLTNLSDALQQTAGMSPMDALRHTLIKKMREKFGVSWPPRTLPRSALSERATPLSNIPAGGCAGCEIPGAHRKRSIAFHGQWRRHEGGHDAVKRVPSRLLSLPFHADQPSLQHLSAEDTLAPILACRLPLQIYVAFDPLDSSAAFDG